MPCFVLAERGRDAQSQPEVMSFRIKPSRKPALCYPVVHENAEAVAGLTASGQELRPKSQIERNCVLMGKDLHAEHQVTARRVQDI